VDAVLEALSRGLTQKMLHGAMAELRAGDAEARERASRPSAPVLRKQQSGHLGGPRPRQLVPPLRFQFRKSAVYCELKR
jgi:hypothetical protein